MLFDKRKGSLLNYIQLPLNVVTPNGTYLGTGYKATGEPTYILSHVRLTVFPVIDLVFSDMSKSAIIDTHKPTLEMKDNILGYGYQVTNTELRYGYITVASQRIDIASGKITKPMANFILEKQLRNVGNVLENSSAEVAGLSKGDKITEIDGEKVQVFNELNLILSKRIGDTGNINIKYIRDGFESSSQLVS